MSALLRLACSLLPGSKVTVQDIVSSELHCGERTLLCSIELTRSKANFTSYHKNEIKVLSEDGTVFEKGECEINIAIGNRLLNVFCLPKRSGKATVKLDLGKWYTFKGITQFPVIFHPASPARLNITKFHGPTATCWPNNSEFNPDENVMSSKDPNFTVDPKLLYNNKWSTLEAVILDEYNNVVTQMDGDCNIWFIESRDDQLLKPIKVSCREAVVKDGILRLQVKGEDVGRQDFLAILQSSNCKDRPNDEYQLQTVQLEVVDPPFSLNLSEIEKPDSCVAGTEPKIRLIPFDVFGNPFLANSTARCNLSGKIFQSPSKNERIACKSVVKSLSISVDVSVILTKTGKRYFEILDNENGSKLNLSLDVVPDLSNVHWEVTSKKHTHKNERLTLTAHLSDQFGNEVDVHPSCQSQLLQESGPEDGLNCTKPLIGDNIVNIKYHFTKKGTYVLSLQFHMHGQVTEIKSWSIDVLDAPIDFDRSSVTWVPEYDDKPLFCDDMSFVCRVNLKDAHGNNYKGDVNHSNLAMKCGETQVKIFKMQPVGSQFDVTVSLQGVFLEQGELEKEFWCFFYGEKITRSLKLSFDGFQEYDKLCQMSETTGFIHCDQVRKNDIVGPEYSYLNNIKRVCKLNTYPVVEEYPDEDRSRSYNTCIQLPPKNCSKTEQFCEMLLHLLKALYYRKQAFEIDKKRELWKKKASESYNRNTTNKIHADWSRPTFCSNIKEKYGTLMNEYHNEACEEFFQFFNTGRNQSEIDLHGLLVADEGKLEKYEQQLRKKDQMSSDEVKAKVQKEREKGDEAIRKLRERLHNYDIKKAREEEESWLEIIVGSGHHSKIKDHQILRPKVEKYLRENHLEFSAVNKGALVITYEKYKGEEPCFGEYYCEKCNCGWRNGRSWVGKWQACYECHTENGEWRLCFPLKQRRKTTAPKSREKFPHLPTFCQKCQELGHPCPEY